VLKNGMPNVHAIGGAESASRRRLKRELPGGRQLFLTERRA
jgi:hypothetical protein